MTTHLEDRLSDAFIEAFDLEYDTLIDREIHHLADQLETENLMTETVQNALLVRQNFSLYTPNEKYLTLVEQLAHSPAAQDGDDDKLIELWVKLFNLDRAFVPFVLVYRDKDIRSAEEFYTHILDTHE